MKNFIECVFTIISGTVLLANCMPNPQGGGQVSLDDVLAAAGNASSRYGTNSGPVDQSALCSVFGGPDCQKDTNNENTNANLDSEYPNSDLLDNPDAGKPANVKIDSKFDNCSYYEEYGYSCVPYYNCKNGEIITDGDSLFDIRGNFGADTRSNLQVIQLDPLASKCPSYLEVCCKDPDYGDYTDELTTIVPTRPPVVTQRPTAPPPTPDPKDPNDCSGQSCPYRQRCGKHNAGGIGVRIAYRNSTELDDSTQSRIQNLDRFSGSTQFGEWPHMCAILKISQVQGREVNLYVGGASLIAPGILLTAAHVFDSKDNPIVDYSKVKVRCGEWDTQQQIEPQKHVDRFAKHISIHPGFNSKNLQNDFALIHLQSEFPLSDHINTMCLPDPVYDDDSYDHSDCFATGWGKDKFGSDGEYQVILKQVQMDVVDHDDCEDDFQKSRLGRKFELDDTFLCAGGQPGKDTCKGDGGGPLVCPSKSNPGQYEQAGIVAWGLGCGSETPGVYADVTKALRFIDWATKCQDGANKDYYGFGFGNRWAKHDYCEYKDKIVDYERLADDEKAKISQARSKSERKSIRRTVKGYNKEVKKMKSLLPLFETAILNCSSGKKDFDCNIYDYDFDDDEEREVDLSTHARDTDSVESSGSREDLIPKVGPRLGNDPE